MSCMNIRNRTWHRLKGGQLPGKGKVRLKQSTALTPHLPHVGKQTVMAGGTFPPAIRHPMRADSNGTGEMTLEASTPNLATGQGGLARGPGMRKFSELRAPCAEKMAQPAKRQPVFTTISELRPDTSGHNLNIKASVPAGAHFRPAHMTWGAQGISTASCGHSVQGLLAIMCSTRRVAIAVVKG